MARTPEARRTRRVYVVQAGAIGVHDPERVTLVRNIGGPSVHHELIAGIEHELCSVT